MFESVLFNTYKAFSTFTMVNIETEVLDFVSRERAVFYSDIARKFHIGNGTARDIVERLRKQRLLYVKNKGISKLVLAKDSQS